MLTLRFLAVRGVPRPSATDASSPRKATWSIRTQGGNNTRFVDLDEGAQHHQHDNEVRSLSFLPLTLVAFFLLGMGVGQSSNVASTTHDGIFFGDDVLPLLVVDPASTDGE